MPVRQLLSIKVLSTGQGPTEDPSKELAIEYPFSSQSIGGYAKVYATSSTAINVEYYLDNVLISGAHTYRPNNPDLSTDQTTYWINDGVNTNTVSNGTHTIKVVGTYLNNIISTRTRTITVDNTAPALPAVPTASNVSAPTLVVDSSITYPITKTGPSTYTNETKTNVRYYDHVVRLAAGTAYEDVIEMFIPESVYTAGAASAPTAVVWFVHGAGSSHASIQGGHNYHALCAVANGAIAISCDFGGTLYSHPTAQRTLRNAYVYLENRFNISKSFMRGTSHGGALSTYAYGQNLIPNLRGIMLGIGVYDIEEKTGNSAAVGVWSDPDDVPASLRSAMVASGKWDGFMASSVYTAFGNDRNLAARNNPARLSRFNFANKTIRIFADNNPTPSLATYMNDMSNGQPTKPGDPIVDFQHHGNMFEQNVTLHGAPLPTSFNFSGSNEGHTESGIPDFSYWYIQMLKNFINS
jgi:hypothetical protein